MRHTTVLLVLSVLVFLPQSVKGTQSVSLDEGRFQISMDGDRVGSESFSIRRSGSGADAQVIATGEIQIELEGEALELRPALQISGSQMAISAYQIKVSGSQQEEIYVTLSDRRFITRIQTERGEQEREFRATPHTLLLDSDVAHQYYFLNSRLTPDGGPLPVIIPRSGRQHDLRLISVAEDHVTLVDGERLPARHVILESNVGASEVWIDSEGRVLRVDRPESGYRALRERAP